MNIVELRRQRALSELREAAYRAEGRSRTVATVGPHGTPGYSEEWSAPGREPAVHPSLSKLADLIEQSEGIIPPEALAYVIGRMRGTINAPRGRRRRTSDERRALARYRHWLDGYLRTRYARRRDAYASLSGRLGTAQLKPLNRAHLRGTGSTPAKLALSRLAKSWGMGEEALRKIVHSAPDD